MKSMMKRSALLGGLALLAVCGLVVAAGDDEAVCPVSGASGASTMPEGMMPPDHGGAPTSRLSKVGSISIRAVQGTKDGPAIGVENVTVELVVGEEDNATIDTKLDEHGVVLIEDLPMMRPFQPRIAVKHGGATFEVFGKPMDAAHPNQQITVPVYETTQEAPKWEMRARHLKMTPSPEGLEVTEMWSLENPSDLAWIGAADPQGRRTTVVVPLPTGASDVEIGGGLHPCCTQVVEGRVVSAAPLNPGLTQATVTYTVPVKDQQAKLDIVAPIPIKAMALLLPADRTTLQGPGVEPDGTLMMGRQMRKFRVPPLEAGQSLLLTVGNLPAPAAADGGSWSTPQILGAVGGGAIAALCVGLLAFRPRKKPKADPVAKSPAEPR